jgi:hypothetical protein
MTELQRRVVISVGAVAVAQGLNHVPVPGLPPGALATRSIAAFWLAPYVSASALVSLFALVWSGSPRSRAWVGRATMIGATVIAFGMSIFQAETLNYVITVRQGLGPLGPVFWCSMLGTPTAGALLLIWLAEAISTWGLGNGACLLVGANLVASAVSRIVRVGYLGEAAGTNPILVVLLVAGWVAALAYWMRAQWVVEGPPAEDSPAPAPLRLRVNAIGTLGATLALALMPAFFALQGSFPADSRAYASLGWITDKGLGYYVVFIALAIVAGVFWTSLVFDHRALPGARRATGSFVVLMPTAVAVLLFAFPRLGVEWFVPLGFLPVIAIVLDTAEQWRVHSGMVRREPAEDEAPCDRCRQPVGVDATHCASCGAVFSEGLQCGEHPDRPAFACCIVCDRGVCPACDHTQHGRHLCDEHRFLDVVEGWVTVARAETRLGAEALAQALLREGTPTTILSNGPAPLHGTLGLYDMRPLVPLAVHPWCGGGDVRVLVPAAWWSRVAARDESETPPLTTP